MDKYSTTDSGNCGFAENNAVQGLEAAGSSAHAAAKKRNLDEELLPKQPVCSTESKPFPLPEKIGLPRYPTEALGPILGGAAKAIAHIVQAPVELAAQAVLGAASLVSQAHIDVARGNLGVGPVSLFLLSIGDSGDRKSTVDRLAARPVKRFEEQRVNEYAERIAEYNADKVAWEVSYKSVLSQQGKQGHALSPEVQAALASDLRVLELEQPQPPSFPNVTFAEPTAAAIWRHYHCGLPFAGLMTDEGVRFFSGAGMREESKGLLIGDLSTLWDGAPLVRTRAAEGESGVMSNRRLAVHLMVQPVVADKALNDPLMSNQGFLARFLVCKPESIAGKRFLHSRNLSENIEDNPAYSAYVERLSCLLSKDLPINKKTGGLELTTMPIVGETLKVWVALHDGIEAELKQYGHYVDIKFTAAKAAENAARIAAVMAFVEGAETINPLHVERAGTLMSWYLESAAVHTRDSQYDKELLDAKILLEWLKARGGTLGASEFKYLPAPFRSAKKARGLLGLLVSLGHLHITANNVRGKPAAWRLVDA
ncbi:DUF3987 domain-containing protein [Saccharophagus degradans]|uniref:DUF3987 domain-containing protein n=1 Tax=Saccharophagus degradans TaxID=86304 RepID=UPI001C08F6D5|nr:DUF3987 domain-containing protein [Saccharophagus degradans]MBU2987256.1 DUF3987 domain-containing protein [Saccharophagus degradans]